MLRLMGERGGELLAGSSEASSLSAVLCSNESSLPAESLASLSVLLISARSSVPSVISFDFRDEAFLISTFVRGTSLCKHRENTRSSQGSSRRSLRFREKDIEY